MWTTLADTPDSDSSDGSLEMEVEELAIPISRLYLIPMYLFIYLFIYFILLFSIFWHISGNFSYYYAGVMLDAHASLLRSKLCRHNVDNSTHRFLTSSDSVKKQQLFLIGSADTFATGWSLIIADHWHSIRIHLRGPCHKLLYFKRPVSKINKIHCSQCCALIKIHFVCFGIRQTTALS